jgi:hypothetical protein
MIMVNKIIMVHPLFLFLPTVRIRCRFKKENKVPSSLSPKKEQWRTKKMKIYM